MMRCTTESRGLLPAESSLDPGALSGRQRPRSRHLPLESGSLQPTRGRRVGANQDVLNRVMRLLVVGGVIDEPEPEIYAQVIDNPARL
jgi:hypothetical protein